MKKLCLALIFLLAVSLADSLEIISDRPMDLGPVRIDSGFYGDQQGNIKLKVNTTKPMVIYAEVFKSLTSDENFQLPADGLRYQVYDWNHGGKDRKEQFKGEILYGADSNWIPYRRGYTPIIRIGEAVTDYEILLGTTIQRIPAVQPNGRYETSIWFELRD